MRADFPLLTRQVHGKPLIYFDSANTGQKPACVIEATDDFYRHHNANVSRAVHAPVSYTHLDVYKRQVPAQHVAVEAMQLAAIPEPRIVFVNGQFDAAPVSYTHLDVYKRQLSLHREGNALFKGENPNFIYTIEFKFIPELGASGNSHAED